MKVLLIKTSSLGDVIHTLPALTDAYKAFNETIQFDWVVEEGFAEIPSWHPAVARVIPVALRRWRKAPLQTFRSGEFGAFTRTLRSQSWDCIIDAQGLLKSAWMTRLNAASSYGYDAQSIKEPLASHFYDHKLQVSRQQHAVERNRQLFAMALGYSPALANGLVGGVPATTLPDYGLQLEPTRLLDGPHVFLLHGTTWGTKHYPEQGWAIISRQLQQKGFQPVVTWGNEVEKQRAERLAATGAYLLPRTSLRQLASYLCGATGAISVDTGLGHLATALNVPLVGLYGPTNPDLSGFYSARQLSLKADYHCAPCMNKTCRYECLGAKGDFEPPCWSALPPDVVVQKLLGILPNFRLIQ